MIELRERLHNKAIGVTAAAAVLLLLLLLLLRFLLLCCYRVAFIRNPFRAG